MQKKIKKTIQVCQNPKCKEEFEGFAKLQTHIVGKRNKINCIRYYGEQHLLDQLYDDAKNEKKKSKKSKISKNR